MLSPTAPLCVPGFVVPFLGLSQSSQAFSKGCLQEVIPSTPE